MKSSAFYAVIGIGVLLVAGIIWVSVSKHEASTKVQPQFLQAQSGFATSTPPLSGLSIYTNGTYGFSIFYPQTDVATTTFDTKYDLPATWRVNALPNTSGTPIFQILGYSTQSNVNYPRYFEAEVRIGASTDPAEVSTCKTAQNGEVAEPDAVIHGTTLNVFSFEDAAMMQYVKATSYRTIHDGTCFALEEVETGSSYQDASSSIAVSDAVLAQKYANLQSVVQSFSFARP
jgi:hypothetical protein